MILYKVSKGLNSGIPIRVYIRIPRVYITAYSVHRSRSYHLGEFGHVILLSTCTVCFPVSQIQDTCTQQTVHHRTCSSINSLVTVCLKKWNCDYSVMLSSLSLMIMSLEEKRNIAKLSMLHRIVDHSRCS